MIRKQKEPLVWAEKILRKQGLNVVVLFTVGDDGKVNHGAAFNGPNYKDLAMDIYKHLHQSLIALFEHSQKGHTRH